MDANRFNVENVDSALTDLEAMMSRLRAVVDDGEKLGDSLSMNLDVLSREEKFRAALSLWRQFSKIQTALTWMELYIRAARRNTNTLLESIPEEAE